MHSYATQKLRWYVKELEQYCHPVAFDLLKQSLAAQEAADHEHGVKADQAKQMPIEEFEMSVRLFNIFRLYKVKTLGQLADMREADFLRFPGVGKKALWQTLELLEENGLAFRK